jgi:hypothetical protein
MPFLGRHGIRHRAPTDLFTLLAGSPGVFAQTNIPPFVAELITHYKSVPPETPPVGTASVLTS